MNKSQCFLRSIVAVIAAFSFVFIFAGGVYAASTIGTNMSTTGTFTQTVGSATAAKFQNAAADTTTLSVDTTSNRVGVGTLNPTTTFEVQGTASASYFLTQNTIQVGGLASVAYSRFGTAATTEAHYISTTNDLLISGDFEVDGSASFAGPASISNALYVSTQGKTGNVGVGTTSPVSLFDVNTKFNVLSDGNVGVGTTTSTTKFEVQGTASASYFLTQNTIQVGGLASVAYSRFGTAATTEAHYISTTDDLLISGDFEVDGSASFAGPSSISNAFYVSTQGKTGNVGVGTTSPITKFEVLGTASSTIGFVSQSLVVGGKTASSATAYIAEFKSTATPSVFFGSSGSKGSCLQLTNTLGKPVYARVVGTTWTVDAQSCR